MNLIGFIREKLTSAHDKYLLRYEASTLAAKHRELQDAWQMVCYWQNELKKTLIAPNRFDAETAFTSLQRAYDHWQALLDELEADA